VTDSNQDRASVEEQAPLIENDIDRANAEVENGLLQFDAAMAELEKWISAKNYKLKPSLIMSLNRIALNGIHPNPGSFRPGNISIRGSGHVPPEPAKVAGFVEEFCDYINDNWDRKSPIHLASYAMWRLNWIHPFSDGNGRTSRIVSHLILCAKLGNRLPGENSIPEQIVVNKKPYYDALEHADKNSTEKTVCVFEMEKLLEKYFAKQLVDLHETAIGTVLEDEKVKPVVKRSTMIGIVENHPVLFTFVGGIFLLLLAWLLG